MMRIVGWEPKECDEQPSRIIYWHSKQDRAWVIQVLNQEGDQLGEATYVGHRDQLKKVLPMMEQEYGIKPEKWSG